MRSIMLISILFSAAALGGCNGVPLSTQWKLRGFNLGTADISQLRVALRTPDWASPTPEKTIMNAKAGRDKPPLPIHLRRGEHAEDRAALARIGAASETVVYEVAPRDLAAVRALQAEAQIAKEAGDKGETKIEGGVACRKADIPEGPIPIQLYIHASDEIGWLPLLENFDVRSQINSAEAEKKFVEGTPLCEKALNRAETAARGK